MTLIRASRRCETPQQKHSTHEARIQNLSKNVWLKSQRRTVELVERSSAKHTFYPNVNPCLLVSPSTAYLRYEQLWGGQARELRSYSTSGLVSTEMGDR